METLGVTYLILRNLMWIIVMSKYQSRIFAYPMATDPLYLKDGGCNHIVYQPCLCDTSFKMWTLSGLVPKNVLGLAMRLLQMCFYTVRSATLENIENLTLLILLSSAPVPCTCEHFRLFLIFYTTAGKRWTNEYKLI